MDGGALRKVGLADCGEPSSPTLGCEKRAQIKIEREINSAIRRNEESGAG